MTLSACGSKGDLYHAEEPKKVQKTTADKSQNNSEKTKKKSQ